MILEMKNRPILIIFDNKLYGQLGREGDFFFQI